MKRAAEISDCGRFRYSLTRDWSGLFPAREPGSVLWIMLNPSTADGTADDPTIHRIVGFTRVWGFHTMLVANLYAYRSTDPKQLWRVEDRCGGVRNDQVIQTLSREAALVVAAWGANAEVGRARRVAELVGRPMVCLGTTAKGFPRHPLYVPGDFRPVAYDPVAEVSDV